MYPSLCFGVTPDLLEMPHAAPVSGQNIQGSEVLVNEHIIHQAHGDQVNDTSGEKITKLVSFAPILVECSSSGETQNGNEHDEANSRVVSDVTFSDYESLGFACVDDDVILGQKMLKSPVDSTQRVVQHFENLAGCSTGGESGAGTLDTEPNNSPLTVSTLCCPAVTSNEATHAPNVTAVHQTFKVPDTCTLFNCSVAFKRCDYFL